MNVGAVIDTGADATIVPVSFLRQVAARRFFEATMRSQWGERRRVYLYLVDIQLETLTLPGIYVVGDDQGNEVILGRDVLNRLRVLLDGPRRVSQVLD
jgi:predicted aspartyl protease